MAEVRNLFPGGNTCYGFHSFYDYMVSSDVKRKYILKGGPGVGKSVLMKNIAEEFFNRGYDIEYHWCSSDSNSLDGIVIGNNEVCFLDGTSPHIVDPKFPGAIDEIINLGNFWNRNLIMNNKENIIKLTPQVAKCFARAYMRLSETNLAYKELKSYYEEAVDEIAVKRNIVALANDFLLDTSKVARPARHLFPGAITPEGLVTRIGSVVDKDKFLFTVEGSPGTGIKDLFQYIAYLVDINMIYAEIYHNPFNPKEIDIIFIPETKVAIVDFSDFFMTYSSEITSTKYKRQLDFNKFVDKSILGLYAKNINSAQNRIEEGLKEAVELISKAKKLHDELESFYIPTMDFRALDIYQQELIEEVADIL